MVKVSVVVPIYNVYDYLDKCLNSLVNQTFKDIEILCINDGSTDNSQAIIDKYVALDSRVKSFIKPNGGLSDARNYGIPHAIGEYIMFIDSDDFCELKMVEKCYEKAIKDNSDIVIFDLYQYFDETNTKEVIDVPFKDDKVYNLVDNPELLAFVNNAAWNKLYRKSLFTDYKIEYPFGYRNQDLGTTPILLHRAKSISFINEPLYNYLADRANNITTTYDKKIYHLLDMINHVITYYREQNIFDTYYEELKYLSVINIYFALHKIRFYTDKKFVDQFINDCFNIIETNFKNTRITKYESLDTKQQLLYSNKILLKIYYRYLLLKGRN